jgi:hypothetical protein
MRGGPNKSNLVGVLPIFDQASAADRGSTKYKIRCPFPTGVYPKDIGTQRRHQHLLSCSYTFYIFCTQTTRAVVLSSSTFKVCLAGRLTSSPAQPELQMHS